MSSTTAGARAARRRAAAVALGVLALAGCSQQSCTQIACTSTVVLDVSGVTGLGATGQPARALVCFGDSDTCVRAAVSQTTKIVSLEVPPGTIPAAGAASDAPVAVSVEVANPGRPLVSGTTRATFTKLAPNGEQCGPVCYTARLVVTNQGVTAVPMGTADATP